MVNRGARAWADFRRWVALLGTTAASALVFALGPMAAVAAGATLFVSPGGTDAGNCQIQATPCKTIGYALSQAAASGDTIDLAAGTYVENPLISKAVSLVGAGAGSSLIDGSHGGSTVWATTGNIVISNLTIERGTNAFGGGIYSTAPSLTLDGVTITLNTAAGGNTPEGGGIYAKGGAVTLNHSTVTANVVVGSKGAKPGAGGAGGNGGAAFGGGIFITGGSLAVTSSTVSANHAIGGAGAAGASVTSGAGGAGGGGGPALGGGIYIENPSYTLTLSHSVVSGNLAESGPGGAGGSSPQGTGGQGGGPLSISSNISVSAGGAGVWDSAANVNVSASTVVGNRALDGSSGGGGPGGGAGGTGGGGQCAAVGGGILVNNLFGGTTYTPNVQISHSKVSFNVARACAGGAGGAGFAGGAGQGGGSGGNGGSGGYARGGGLFVNGFGMLSITASVVSSNMAQGGKGANGADGGAGGAGSPTSSIGPPGGQGGNGGLGGAGFGGGIFATGPTTVAGSTVSGNTAAGGNNGDGGAGGGGGSGAAGSTGGQGGNGGSGGGTGGSQLGAEGGGFYGGGDITNTTVASNAITGGYGGNAGSGGDGGSGPAGPGAHGAAGVGGYGQDARGGGMLWLGEGVWFLTNDTIDGNSTTGGNFGLGTPPGTSGSGSGGGAWIQGGTLANSIVALNVSAPDSGTSPDCGGEITTGGDNLISAIDGCNGIVAGQNGDQAGTNLNRLSPDLAPLGNNGGPTPTMAELSGSPAIGHGSATTCQSTLVGDKDQRGYPRLSARRGVCDTGAYDSAEPERLAVTAPTSATHGTSFSVTVTAVDPSGHTVTNFQDTVHFTSTDPTAILPRDFTFSSADNGTHTFAVTLNKTGSQTISVVDTAAHLIRGTSGTISVS